MLMVRSSGERLISSPISVPHAISAWHQFGLSCAFLRFPLIRGGTGLIALILVHIDQCARSVLEELEALLIFKSSC